MEFVGPAGNTVSFMRFLYQQGEKDLVEAIFENVRAEDTHAHANHPSHSHMRTPTIPHIHIDKKILAL
jgi:hypothetical protein